MSDQIDSRWYDIINHNYLMVIDRAKSSNLPTQNVKVFASPVVADGIGLGDTLQLGVVWDWVTVPVIRDSRLDGDKNDSHILILDPAWGKSAPAAYRRQHRKHQSRPPWRRCKRG